MVFLYVAPRFHPNQFPIIEGLIEKGHEICFCVAHIGAHEKHTGVKLIQLPMSKMLHGEAFDGKPESVASEDLLIKRFTTDWGKIWRIIGEEKPDIVILRDRSLLSLQFSLICKMKRIPAIVYNQSPLLYPAGAKISLHDWKKILWRKLFPKYRITPCLYERYPDPGVEYQRDKNAWFLPFVSRKDAFLNQSIRHREGKPRIIDIGKMRPYKNHTVLVKAASILRERGFDFQITILGQCIHPEEFAYRDRMLNLIGELGLEDRVEVLDSVSYDAVMKTLSKYQIYVLPSKTEVANVTILDAMSCGLAVLATNCNGTSHYIDDGVNGSIFQTDDPQSLADKLEVYLKDPSTIQEHGEAAVRKVQEKFGFEAYYKQFEIVLDRVLKHREYRNNHTI